MRTRGTSRTRAITRYAALALSAGALAVGATACGGSSSDDGGSGGSTSTAAAKGIKKKTIGYVDLIHTGAMQRRFYNYFTAGTNVLGWKVLLQDAKGDPTVANTQAINLLNQGIDALVVSCADSAPMRPALQLAKRKKIPAIQLGCPMTNEDAWDASFPIDDAAVGKVIGQYAAKELGAGAQSAVLGDTTILAGNVRTGAIKSALDASGAKVVANQSVDLSDVVGATRKTTSTFLTGNPNLKAIFAVYDFFAPPAGDTIQSAGRKVNVYSFYADAVNAPYMKKPNSPLRAVADGPVEQVGLLAVDQLLGHFQANKPFDSAATKSLKVPYEVFTAENLPKLGSGYLGPYPVAKYLAPMEKKWTAEYGAL